jgi:hypothetical protein
MGFVLEKISEEDKKKYGFDSKPYFRDMWKSWAIDRDRDVFLIKVGAAGMGIGKYELHYGDDKKIVNFYAEERAVGNNGDAIFKILLPLIPLSMKSQVEMVKLDICNSLKKYGYFANPKDKGEVVINLPNDSEISFKQDSN